MHIGIVGYGKMGADLFRVMSRKLYHITVLVRHEEQATRNETKVFKGLERSLKRGTIMANDYCRRRQSLRFTHRMEDLTSVDLIVETAVEDLQEKINIFRKLESVVSKTAVLVTNTSSISIQHLVEALEHKERFCGLHFFYPAMLIDLVEIITCTDTPVGLVNGLKDFCRSIDKKPIVVKDAPASVINAILAYYYAEALYILEEGLAPPSKIDALAKRIFYVGPCESMDIIGIEFLIEALKRAATPGSLSPLRWTDRSQMEIPKTAIGGREGFSVPYLFGKLMSENRLGKRVSKGIYRYHKDKAVDEAPEFYVNPARSDAVEPRHGSEELVVTRLLYSIFNGCLYSLTTEMSSMEELDLGVKEVLHMEQGPFTMMRAMGRRRLTEEFALLTQHVGERFRPTRFDFIST